MLCYAKSLQSRLTLRDPVDGSLPGSFTASATWKPVCVGHSVMSDCSQAWTVAFSPFSVHRIFQVIVVQWVAIPISRGPSRPRDQTQVSVLQADPLQFEHLEAHRTFKVKLSFAQLCQTLCDP